MSLSFTQEYLWPSNNSFTTKSNSVFLSLLKGRPNLKLLQQALSSLKLQRDFNGNDLIKMSPPLLVKDIRKYSEESQTNKIKSFLEKLQLNHQDSYLINYTLFLIEDNISLLTIAISNAVIEKISVENIFSQIAETYNTLAPKEKENKKFSSSSKEEKLSLVKDTADSHFNYWQSQLGEIPDLLNIPTDRARSIARRHQSSVYTYDLSQDLLPQIKKLEKKFKVNSYILLMAVFKVLLHRYSVQDDIIINSPNKVAVSKIEEHLGFFTDTFILRTSCEDNPPFDQFLKEVLKSVVSAYENREVSLEQISQEFYPQGTSAPFSLFQVRFMLEDRENSPFFSQDLNNKRIWTGGYPLKADLVFLIETTQTAFNLHFKYNADLFEEKTFVQMAESFECLLKGIILNPQQRIDELPLLSPEKQQYLLTEWNKTEINYPTHKTLHELFEEQVKKTPNAIAIIYEKQKFTYKELNEKSNQLAHYLRKQGVKTEVPVIICIDRSIDLVIGLFGILKAGGLYIPLDADYPQERMQFVIEETKAPFILTEQASSENINSILKDIEVTTTTILLDHSWDAIGKEKQTDLPPITNSDNLAYIIYTSGSTGNPKGVVIDHKGAVNTILSMNDLFHVDEKDKVFALSAISFDLSVYDIFGTLAAGATIIMPKAGYHKEPSYWLEIMQRHPITVWNSVPALMQMFIDYIKSSDEPSYYKDFVRHIRLVLLSGDWIPLSLPNDILEFIDKKTEVISLGGATEASIWSIFYPIKNVSPQWNSIPYGKPLPNQKFYILDNYLEPVPVGVMGQLCIGGVGVAKGYWKNAEKTEDSFLIHPKTKEYIYKTGDHGRYFADGNIEFLGRVDNQVKIRGFRIELGEIESVLRQSEDVNEALATVREDHPGEKQIVAYIIVQKGVSENKPEDLLIENWSHVLRQKLPEYMIPSHFIILTHFPLSANGKVDHKKLPAPTQRFQKQNASYVAPRTPIESKLVEIWSEVLNIPQIGIHDHFFMLGGHSLLATQVMSRIRRHYGIELLLRRLFEFPTVEQLALHIENVHQTNHAQNPTPFIQPVERDKELPLSFAQQRLWFFDQFTPGKAVYNIHLALRLEGKLDREALHQALDTIIGRHEALRTTIVTKDNNAVQVIASHISFPLLEVDLSALSDEEQAIHLKNCMDEEANRGFNLSEGSLIRGQLIGLKESIHTLLVTMHHIVSDGWSISLFCQELSQLYNAFSIKKTITLPPLPIQYVDFALWQRQKLLNGDLEQQIAYWKKQLDGVPEGLDLPTDKARPTELTYQGRHYTVFISKDLLEQLKVLSERQEVTLFMTLLAAFQVLLYRYTNQEDIAVGSLIANRHYTEVEGLIGFFANTLVLRAHCNDQLNFKDFLKQVKETTLSAYENQDVPFEQLVDHLQVSRHLNQHPIFQVLFILQNMGEFQVNFEGIKSHRLSVENKVSKFDLSLIASETSEGLELLFEYTTDLFLEETISRMGRHFEQLLKSIVAHPEAFIHQLSFLTAKEQHQLLIEWNQTEKSYPEHKTVPQLFEEGVKKAPDKIAVVFDDVKLNYRDLNKKANQLARYLRQQGVKPETLVAISLERSVDLVIGMIAILKAGGAYVPLDPSYPEERLQFMWKDSQTPLLLTHTHLAPQFKDYSGQLVLLDAHKHKWNQQSEENLELSVSPHHLAYVIYTSGSTGNPKGVMIEHKGVVFSICARFIHYPQRVTNCLLLPSIAFDSSVTAIFWTLLQTGALTLSHQEALRDAAEIASLIHLHQITHIQCVPTFYAELLSQHSRYDLSSLKLVVAAGEPCPQQLVEQHGMLLPNTDLANEYGPTEASVWSTTTYVYSTQIGRCCEKVTIGHSAPNAKNYVLDDYQQLMPVSIPGELYIGGDGVGRGYLNRPDLTAERFIANPFQTKEEKIQNKNAKLYKTGDLVKWLPEGNLEYIGRNDFQVKIRGFRIELEEIETTLSSYEGVKQSIVLVKEHLDQQGEVTGNKYLAAYYVSEHELDEEKILKYLRDKLPEYMMPHAFIHLKTLPLSVNGKIDRRALPDPEFTSKNHYTAPKTKIEAQLCQIWAETLKIDQSSIGIKDNFFDLGGNSILIIRLKSNIEKELEIKDLRVADLFKYPTIKSLSDSLFKEDQALLNHKNKKVFGNIGLQSQEIAVVGMSGSFSGSKNIEEYWDNILNGKECLERLSEESCKRLGVPETIINNKSFIPVSGIIKDTDTFDPSFWSFSLHDASLLDPHIRKFLEHSWVALEQSGYIRGREEKNIGVFAGMSTSKYSKNREKGGQQFSSQMNSWEMQSMNDKDFFATRVSYLLGLTGPALNINTACSTSLVAIVEACQNLILGVCDMALAGGTSLSMPEDHGYVYQEGVILSKDGHCRVFDENSSGTVSGAGVGVVILKRLQDAIQDKDNIIAIIKGYATNNDGNRKVGYTAPSVIGQTECILKALEVAQITADTVDYVECHGTGTSLGDPIEITALHDAFKASSTDNEQKYILGAVKANIGHADSAAGIAGFIKVCKMLETGTIPPQILFETPNPSLNLEKSNFEIITTKQAWATTHKPRRAGVSAFGIGGTNAHVIMEEYKAPTIAIASGASDHHYILPLSANSLTSYNQYCDALKDYLTSDVQTTLADISYTLQNKREYFGYRGTIVCKDKKEAIEKIEKRKSPVKLTKENPELIFMFPGQGTQYVNMAKDLYEREPVFKQYIDKCCQIISGITQTPFNKILFADSIPTHDSLKETQWSQPALFTISYSLAKFLESLGLSATSYIGHSVGEYVAATLSGVFTLEDALKVVVKRGQLMQQMPQGTMIAVNASPDKIREILPNNLEISVYNSPEHIVISGENAAIDAFASKLHTQQIPYSKLNTSHAFHSQMMEEASKKFKEYLRTIPLKVSHKAFISNVTGEFIQDDLVTSPDYWASHIRKPVLFFQGLETLIGDFRDALYLEVGPGNSLSTFVNQYKQSDNSLPPTINILPSAKEALRSSSDDRERLYTAIGKLWSFGYDVPWSKIRKDDVAALKQASIPGYQFEKKRCWIELPGAKEENTLAIREKDEWLYQPTWTRVSKTLNPQGISLEKTSCWLIFRDKLGQLDSFIRLLNQNNLQTIVIDYSTSNEYAVINQNGIVINPHIESHYNDLSHYLIEQKLKFPYIIHGWTLTDPEPSVEEQPLHALGFYSLFLLQTHIFSKIKENAHLAVLTNGLNQVTGKDVIHPTKGTMLGALRVIPHEIPKIKACVLDIGFNEDIKNDYLLSFITNKNNYALEPNYSIRFSYLWKETIEPVVQENQDRSSLINDNDIILISGGLGGIGLAIAKEIAKKHRVKFILVNRSGLKGTATDPYKKFQLESLDFIIKAQQCEVDTYACDLSQVAEVNKLIHSVRRKFKKIDGVIHAAGNPPLSIPERNLQTIQNAIGAKVFGAENLLNALTYDSVKFFVMTSSLASLMGDIGRLEYCAANSYLDVLSGQELNNIGHMMSINWPGWSDIGMSLKAANNSFSEKSMKVEDDSVFNMLKKNTLTEVEGAEIFYDLLNQRNYKQIAVSKLNLMKMKQELFENNTHVEKEFPPSDLQKILIEDGTDLENKVAHIFCQVLGNQTLSKHDNYFELGGTSLSAIKLVNQLNQNLNANINISTIFEYNTVAKLAEHVSANLNTAHDLSIVAEGEL